MPAASPGYDLRLVDGDIPLQNGGFITGTALTIQRLPRRLKTNLGEVLTDRFAGIDLLGWLQVRPPDPALMEEIVHVHFPDIRKSLLREALKAFYSLREVDEFRKKPSTSELIDWIRALIAGGIPHENISKEIPFSGTLLKKETDYDYFVKNYLTKAGNAYILRRK